MDGIGCGQAQYLLYHRTHSFPCHHVFSHSRLTSSMPPFFWMKSIPEIGGCYRNLLYTVPSSKLAGSHWGLLGK